MPKALGTDGCRGRRESGEGSRRSRHGYGSCCFLGLPLPPPTPAKYIAMVRWRLRNVMCRRRSRGGYGSGSADVLDLDV